MKSFQTYNKENKDTKAMSVNVVQCLHVNDVVLVSLILISSSIIDFEQITDNWVIDKSFWKKLLSI